MIRPHAGILLACLRRLETPSCVATQNPHYHQLYWYGSRRTSARPTNPNKKNHDMPKRFSIFSALTLVCLLVLPSVFAQDKDAAKKPEPPAHEPIGYFLGISVGQQMSQTGFKPGDFDIEALLAGFNDGLQQKEAALTDDQLKETQAKIQALLQKRQQEMQLAQQQKGAKFLADNASKDGVKTLEGGVQYKVLTAGKGDSPALTDTVKVHYTGTLIDGKVFDSSVQRGEPATFRVNQVIKGWQMALQEMKVGDKWMLYIPSDLAYGERGSQGAIGPNEVLVFEVELLAIQ